jgi:hypothetical protein
VRIASKPLAGIAFFGVMLAGGLALAAPHLRHPQQPPQLVAVAPIASQPISDPALLAAITHGGPPLPNAVPRYATTARPASAPVATPDDGTKQDGTFSPDELDGVVIAGGPGSAQPLVPPSPSDMPIESNASAEP